jgi:uncharacterized Fe-S center protein
MSVRVSERSQGDLDVIVKAKQMAVHTAETTNNTNYFPKRYRLTITDKIVDKSFEIFTLLYEANEIYPRNKRDFEERQRNQRRAMACCRMLVAMIDVSKTLFHLPADKVSYWTKLVVEVRYMTAAWYKKELDRFGKQFADKAEAKEERFITEMELSLLEMVMEMRR